MPAAFATALASADRPYPDLAAEVVGEALRRAGGGPACSILLLLSSEFCRAAAGAVAAASRAARCLQVAGCTVTGLFNEREWILDRPAACALVLTGPVSLAPPGTTDQPVLSLASPPGGGAEWLGGARRRFGLLASGAGAQPARVWCHAKLAGEGRCELAFAGARGGVGVSRGIRPLSEPVRVTATRGYDLLRVGAHPALPTLRRALPVELRQAKELPLHLIVAGVLDGDEPKDMEQGRYTLVPVLAHNGEDLSVTLAAPVPVGARLFWGIRQPLATERDSRVALVRAEAELGGRPDFAVVFSCMGRGPYFFGGRDRDLDLLKERYPGLPLVGGYGPGEIAPLSQGNRSINNSAVFALFRSDVQP